MLNKKEKNTLKMILKEALVDIEDLVASATNDNDRSELIDESETLKSVIAKLGL